MRSGIDLSFKDIKEKNEFRSNIIVILSKNRQLKVEVELEIKLKTKSSAFNYLISPFLNKKIRENRSNGLIAHQIEELRYSVKSKIALRAELLLP